MRKLEISFGAPASYLHCICLSCPVPLGLGSEFMLSFLGPSFGQLIIFGTKITKSKRWPSSSLLPTKRNMLSLNYEKELLDVGCIVEWTWSHLYCALQKLSVSLALSLVEKWRKIDTRKQKETLCCASPQDVLSCSHRAIENSIAHYFAQQRRPRKTMQTEHDLNVLDGGPISNVEHSWIHTYACWVLSAECSVQRAVCSVRCVCCVCCVLRVLCTVVSKKNMQVGKPALMH